MGYTRSHKDYKPNRNPPSLQPARPSLQARYGPKSDSSDAPFVRNGDKSHSKKAVGKRADRRKPLRDRRRRWHTALPPGRMHRNTPSWPADCRSDNLLRTSTRCRPTDPTTPAMRRPFVSFVFSLFFFHSPYQSNPRISQRSTRYLSAVAPKNPTFI